MLLAVLVAAALLAPSYAGARRVKLPASVVVEEFTAGTGCATVPFLQISTGGGNFDSFTGTVHDSYYGRDTTFSGPPFPDDNFNAYGIIRKVSAGAHRWALAGVFGSNGCDPAAAGQYLARFTNPRAFGGLDKGCSLLSGTALTTSYSGPAGSAGRQVGVPGVRIRAIAGSGAAAGTALTDASGHYSMALCKKGTYAVAADRQSVIVRNSFSLSTYRTYNALPPVKIVQLTGDDSVDFFIEVQAAVFPDVSPEPPPTQSYWSTPYGQKVLKTWAVAEGAVAYDAKVTLGAAKAIKDAAPAGLELAKDVKFVATKANPYLTAVDLGLTGGALIDGAYALLADPFDPQYRVVSVPQLRPAPSVSVGDPRGRRVLSSFLGNMARMGAIGRALLTTVNRLSSATQMGDATARQLQAQAASRYLDELAGLTDAQVGLQEKIATLLSGLLRSANLGRISLPRSAIRAYERQLRYDGLPFDEGKLLSSLGASLTYATDWAEREASAPIPASIDLPRILRSTSTIRAGRMAAAALRADASRLRSSTAQARYDFGSAAW